MISAMCFTMFSTSSVVSSFFGALVHTVSSARCSICQVDLPSVRLWCGFAPNRNFLSICQSGYPFFVGSTLYVLATFQFM
jgi:hypothetical protein